MREENLEKATKKRLAEILPQLTKDQLRFIVALQEYPSKDAAAKALKLRPQLTYEWPDIVDEAAKLMALDAVESARELRRRNLIKAMGVKAAGLDSKSEAVRQKAASEIIEWELGKAQAALDLTTKGDKIVFVIESDTDEVPSSAEGG